MIGDRFPVLQDIERCSFRARREQFADVGLFPRFDRDLGIVVRKQDRAVDPLEVK